MSPTFKQLLQDETYNGEKNKSYYQRYDVKRTGAFNNQAITKQKIYENILARRIETDYSPGIRFKKILVNMDEAKALTKNNQLGKINQSKEDDAGVDP